MNDKFETGEKRNSKMAMTDRYNLATSAADKARFIEGIRYLVSVHGGAVSTIMAQGPEEPLDQVPLNRLAKVDSVLTEASFPGFFVYALYCPATASCHMELTTRGSFSRAFADVVSVGAESKIVEDFITTDGRETPMQSVDIIYRGDVLKILSPLNAALWVGAEDLIYI